MGGVSPARCARATGFSDSKNTGGDERVSNSNTYVELKARPVTERLRPTGARPCSTSNSVRRSRSCFTRAAVSCSSWAISASMEETESMLCVWVLMCTEGGNSVCQIREGFPCNTNSCQAEMFQMGPTHTPCLEASGAQWIARVSSNKSRFVRTSCQNCHCRTSESNWKASHDRTASGLASCKCRPVLKKPSSTWTGLSSEIQAICLSEPASDASTGARRRVCCVARRGRDRPVFCRGRPSCPLP